MNKRLLFSSILSLLTISLQAAEKEPKNAPMPPEKRPPTLENYTRAANGYGAYVRGQALYTTANVEQFTTGAVVNFVDSTTYLVSNVDNANTKNAAVDSHFSWGSDIGIGYKMPFENQIEWSFNWVHLANRLTSSATSLGTVTRVAPKSFGNYINPTYSSNYDYVQNGYSSLNFYIDELDLSIKRSFVVAQGLSFAPSFGVCGGWFRSKILSTYTNGQVDSTLKNKTKNFSRFEGIGLKAGLDAEYRFTKCFFLQGSISFSGQTGLSKSSFSESDVTSFITYAGTTEIETATEKYSSNVHANRAYTDIGAYLGYEDTLLDSNLFLRGTLGYRQFFFNDFIQVIPNPGSYYSGGGRNFASSTISQGLTSVRGFTMEMTVGF